MAEPKVFANGRSILHAGDGLTHTAAAPDVCKTPSPGGPIPVPYVNAASDADLAKGTKSVRIEGNAVALESSNLRTSTGDEPGTAGGGLISAKTKGKLTWATSSADVRFEGKGVVRFMDVTQHNGNSFNTAFTAMGGTGLAYADDFEGKCPICSKGPRQHRILETPNSAALCSAIVRRLNEDFARQPSNNQRKKYARAKPGGAWGGYMVGVMVCKCGKTFAAMSGGTLDGFAAAAGGFVDQTILGGPASSFEMAGANTSKAAGPTQKLGCIEEAWKRIQNKSQSDDQGVRRGYNAPGACAGAKLLARSGHAPIEMTEMMFSPMGSWSQEYALLTTRRSPEQISSYSRAWKNKILQNQAARRPATTFTVDDSVASCHTCQELLFMTNCPERTC